MINIGIGYTGGLLTLKIRLCYYKDEDIIGVREYFGMKKYFSYDRTVPMVNFDSKEIELFMMDFMLENIDGVKNVCEYVGLVMLRLGFKSDDKIEFIDIYNNKNSKDKIYRCIVNGQDYYDIKFMNVGNNKINTEISLVDYNEEITYECEHLKVSEIGIKIIPVREMVMFVDGVTYVRELSNDRAKFELYTYDDYKLELDVVKPKDLELPIYDSNWNYSRYRLDNEMVLRNYLINFFPIVTRGNIVSLYKTIVKLSLGNDIGRYPEIVLRFSFDGKITDLIHLKNGELERFGISLLRMDRTLFIEKDGSFTYEINDSDKMFNISMNVMDDRTNYNISISNDSDVGMISEIISNDVDTIKRDVGLVKRLVKNIFDNKKN